MVVMLAAMIVDASRYRRYDRNFFSPPPAMVPGVKPLRYEHWLHSARCG